MSDSPLVSISKVSEIAREYLSPLMNQYQQQIKELKELIKQLTRQKQKAEKSVTQHIEELKTQNIINQQLQQNIKILTQELELTKSKSQLNESITKVLHDKPIQIINFIRELNLSGNSRIAPEFIGTMDVVLLGRDKRQLRKLEKVNRQYVKGLIKKYQDTFQLFIIHNPSRRP